MKQVIFSRLSSKLVSLIMLVMIIMLGATSIFITVLLKRTYFNTVVNDISVSVALLDDLIETYTETLSGQMITQINTMLSVYEGDLSIDYDNRIKTDGIYSAPTLRKGDVVLNNAFDTFKSVSDNTGFALTLFVWDNNDFMRTMTVLPVANDNIYGKPLYIPADKRPAALAGEIIYYTMFLNNSIKIGITYPLTDKNGTVLGAITTSTDLDLALKQISNSLDSMSIGGESGYLYLIDADTGMLIIHPTMRGQNSFEVLDRNNEPFMKKIAEMRDGSAAYSLPVDKGYEDRYAIFSYIPSLNWIVGASIKSDEIYSVSNRVAITLFVAIAITALTIILSLRYAVKKLITQPIGKISNTFKEMAEGDFSQTIKVTSMDEIGGLSQNLNMTIDQLNEILNLLEDASKKVYESSESVGNANEEMSNGAVRQAESATVMSAAIEELEYSIKEMSLNVENTAEEANKIKHNAENGGEVLAETVESIQRLSQSVILSSNNVNALAEATSKITSVLNVITDIADQTNLLALNAAIEAARAGDAGRGFAVVADEVRKLAEKTVTATKEISTMVAGINNSVIQTLDDMHQGVALAKQGEDNTIGLNHAIQKIIDGVIVVSDKINDITTILYQQREATQNTLEQVHSVAFQSEENARFASDNVVKVDNLKELAGNLMKRVSAFKLKS